MYRTLSDFEASWAYESEAMLKVLRALTEASLGQRVTDDGRTLGRMAWHTVVSVPEMARHAGLPGEGPDGKAPMPALAEMIAVYERAAKALPGWLRAHWTDEMLLERIPMYGEEWTRGQTLSALIAHQIHHRAQMTVLMRQAGLKVPGIYGPAREEWAAYGMPAEE